MLATKDHFILIASSDKVGTELWSGYSEGFNVQVANTLGFLCTGEVSAFLRANNTWNAYTTVEAPFLMVRPHFGNLGIVSKQESTKFGCIIPREFHKIEQFFELSNASQIEALKINNTDESIGVADTCKFNILRDVNTFEIIEENLEPSNYIFDSDIEIEGI
jgi:hypothetical protein